MPVLLKGITLPSSLSYPKISEFELFDIMSSCPVQTGLVGSYFLGSVNVDPAHNFATPTAPLVRVGNPVTTRQYATLSKAGYYDTGLKQSQTQTIICMSRFQSIKTGAVSQVSNYFKDSTGLATGDSLMFTSGSARTYASTETGVGQASVNLTTPVAGEMRVSAALVSDSPAVGAYILEGQVVTRGVAALPSRAVSQRNMLIGTTHSTDEFLEPSEVSAVLIYNTDIGVANLELVMKWLRNDVGVKAGIWPG